MNDAPDNTPDVRLELKVTLVEVLDTTEGAPDIPDPATNAPIAILPVDAKYNTLVPELELALVANTVMFSGTASLPKYHRLVPEV